MLIEPFVERLRSASLADLHTGKWCSSDHNRTVKRRPFEVQVGVAVPNVVVHHGRQLVQRPRPCLHQTAGRIVIAEQHISQRVSFFLTAVSQVQNGRHVLLRPVDRVRETGNQDDDRSRIRADTLA